MIPRPFLVVLVFGLPILVLTFGVLMGASALTSALGDAAAAYALFWVAMAALLVSTINALVLLAVLGIRLLNESRDDESSESR